MKQKGFTLIEILVVIAIIGILSSVIMVSVNTAAKKARDLKRVADVRQIQMALHMYKSKEAVFPSSLSVLAPTYINSTPVDPDGHSEYQYCLSANGFHLGTRAQGLDITNNTFLNSDSDTSADFCQSGGFSGDDPVYDVSYEANH